MLIINDFEQRFREVEGEIALLILYSSRTQAHSQCVRGSTLHAPCLTKHVAKYPQKT